MLWQLQVVKVDVFVLGGKAGVTVVGAVTAGCVSIKFQYTKYSCVLDKRIAIVHKTKHL